MRLLLLSMEICFGCSGIDFTINCIFSISNWFYPYQNWGISAEDAFSFDFISKGSKIIIEEFPSSDDFIDTKEKIEKI